MIQIDCSVEDAVLAVKKAGEARLQAVQKELVEHEATIRRNGELLQALKNIADDLLEKSVVMYYGYDYLHFRIKREDLLKVRRRLGPMEPPIKAPHDHKTNTVKLFFKLKEYPGAMVYYVQEIKPGDPCRYVQQEVKEPGYTLVCEVKKP